MKRIIRLTESDLRRIVRRVIMEQNDGMTITLPQDVDLPVDKGIYKKDNERLLLYKLVKNGISVGPLIYGFTKDRYPEYDKIPNTPKTGYSKDLKTWEQDPGNPQNIILHSENKFLNQYYDEINKKENQ